MVTDSKGGETPVKRLLLRLIRTVPNPAGSAHQRLARPVSRLRPATNEVTFTVKGIDNDLDARVALTSGNVPLGATMVPSLPTAGTSPQSSVFTWTPTLQADAGNNTTIQFAVTDEFGAGRQLRRDHRAREFPADRHLPRRDDRGGNRADSIEDVTLDADVIRTAGARRSGGSSTGHCQDGNRTRPNPGPRKRRCTSPIRTRSSRRSMRSGWRSTTGKHPRSRASPGDHDAGRRCWTSPPTSSWKPPAEQGRMRPPGRRHRPGQ